MDRFLIQHSSEGRYAGTLEGMLPVSLDHEEFRLYSRFKPKKTSHKDKKNNEIALFLHGLGCNQRYWDGIWENFNFQSKNLMTLDLPAHGQSLYSPNNGHTWHQKIENPRTCDLPFIAQVIDGAILSLRKQFPHITKVSLIGHSLSGSIATLLAEQVLTNQDSQYQLGKVINIDGNLTVWDTYFSNLVREAYLKNDSVPPIVSELTNILYSIEPQPIKTWTDYVESVPQNISPADFTFFCLSLYDWSQKDPERKDKSNLGYLWNRLMEIPNKEKDQFIYIAGEKSNSPVIDYLSKRNFDFLKGLVVSNSGHFIMKDAPEPLYLMLSGLV
ncbi:MAG: alpha/beta hydrolase [Candidatus Woesearchaeota archaeon]|nr:alpha/beta hydrolase [Candidatus Woesearchaeota archaeon]